MRRAVAAVERLRSVIGLAIVIAKAAAIYVRCEATVAIIRIDTVAVVCIAMVPVVCEAMIDVRCEAMVPIVRKATVAIVAATDIRSATSVEAMIVSTSRPARAAGPSIEAADPPIIDVVEVASAEVVVPPVVTEVAMIPVAAVEAGAEVAEAVINAAVIADASAPVAGIPEVAVAAIAPVSGGPERADIRRLDPRSIDPLVAIAGPGPITRSPDVAIARDCRLYIHRDNRRSDCNRDKDTCVGWPGSSNQQCSRYRDGADRILKKTSHLHGSTFPTALRFARPCLTAPEFENDRFQASVRLSSPDQMLPQLDTVSDDLLRKYEWRFSRPGRRDGGIVPPGQHELRCRVGGVNARKDMSSHGTDDQERHDQPYYEEDTRIDDNVQKVALIFRDVGVGGLGRIGHT